jgi:hypothetical protein
VKRPAALAAILLAAFGADLVYGKYFSPTATAKPLRIPFQGFPMDLLGPEWKGEDVPMKAETEKIASVTDYIQRSYSRGGGAIWFYVGYVPGWNPSGIHHPGICFPLHGLVLEDEEYVTVPAPEIPKELRFKESRWRDEAGHPVCTLTTFYFRGKFEPAELQLRADRFLGIDYYAIITISGGLLGSFEETRRVYHDLLRAAVLELLRRFPE